jgi:hypothetical protein
MLPEGGVIASLPPGTPICQVVDLRNDEDESLTSIALEVKSIDVVAVCLRRTPGSWLPISCTPTPRHRCRAADPGRRRVRRRGARFMVPPQSLGLFGSERIQDRLCGGSGNSNREVRRH